MNDFSTNKPKADIQFESTTASTTDVLPHSLFFILAC